MNEKDFKNKCFGDVKQKTDEYLRRTIQKNKDKFLTQIDSETNDSDSYDKDLFLQWLTRECLHMRIPGPSRRSKDRLKMIYDASKKRPTGKAFFEKWESYAYFDWRNDYYDDYNF